MYIPSYQIHNVLNVYRKQLSQGPAASKAKPAAPRTPQDRIQISSAGQRQSIIDKISSEIVDRIAQQGPEARFGSVLADKLERPVPETSANRHNGDSDFSYTVIDEHNRKITNTLPVRNFSPMSSLPADGSKAEGSVTLKEE